MEQKNFEQLKIVIVGHVDHGKSSLIGRLLFDTQSVPPNKQEEIKIMSDKRGMDMEWSFVLDSFQAERDQAITIDTTQIWFRSKKREYVIIDAPGHREFLKNMVSGAAAAEAAVLVIDAKEGIKEQTKRHAYLLHLLGIKQIVVAINKMDLVGNDHETFKRLSDEATDYLASLGLEPHSIIPISARQGDNIANKNNTNMNWFEGTSIVDTLDTLSTVPHLMNQDLRFPVQDVYRFDEQRIIVGRLESGSLKKGDTILFSPTNESATITSIESWPANKELMSAKAGECIGITLDQPIFVERGHIGSTKSNAPMLSNVFRANLFWLSKKPLKVGNSYKIRISTQEVLATVQSIEKSIDTQDLKENSAEELTQNGVGEIIFRTRDVVSVDPFSENSIMGRCVISDGFDVAGGGILNMDGFPDQRVSYIKRPKNIYTVEHLIPHEDRAKRNGHYGAVFWFTGLSGAGKSTLAMNAERALFEEGFHTYVLDGDNVRHGLNKDLGFSPEDRTENIRRVAEVAALQADAGLLTITSFISPYREDRQSARDVTGEHFHEIFVKADLETCESRDPKELYKKAREGKIKEFTGISSPYEEPDNPDLIVDTQRNDLDTCVNQIVEYIKAHVSFNQNTNSEKKVASV